MGMIKSNRPAPEPVVTLASSGGVLTLDLSTARRFEVTLTENITSVVFTNAPAAGFGASFLLWITQHASSAKTFAMPAAFDWDNGVVGAISAAFNSVDLLAASTRDGTTWDVTLSKARA